MTTYEGYCTPYPIFTIDGLKTPLLFRHRTFYMLSLVIYPSLLVSFGKIRNPPFVSLLFMFTVYKCYLRCLP